MKLTNQNGQDLNEENSLSDSKTDRFDNEESKEIPIEFEIPKFTSNCNISLEDLQLEEPEFLKEALKLFGKVEDENPVWSIALERKNWKKILAKVEQLKQAKDSANKYKTEHQLDDVPFNIAFHNHRITPLNVKPKRKKNLFNRIKDQFVKHKNKLLIQFQESKNQYRKNFYNWLLYKLDFWSKEIKIQLIAKPLQSDARLLGSDSKLFKIVQKRKGKFSLSRMNQIKNHVDNRGNHNDQYGTYTVNWE